MKKEAYSQQMKLAILQACHKHIEARITTAQEALSAARAASHDDTKSSAGDKYETGREMMQQEITRNDRLLAEAMDMGQIVKSIAPDKYRQTGGVGAIIETNRGLFFLGPGIGPLQVGNEQVFVISPSSPIGRLLVGCKPQDVINYANRSYVIREIY